MRTAPLFAILKAQERSGQYELEQPFLDFYAAAHTAAAIFDEVLELEMIGIRQAGPWAWVVPGVCLILLTLDLTGRLSLRGSGGKMLAALVLPLLCSCGEVLLWDDHIPERTAPAVCACVCSLLLLAAYLLAGSVYSLKENEYAVVSTFGVPKVVEESGIHLKLPYIQSLRKVPKTINGFPIGYRTDSDVSVDDESFMITRDYNFVNVDFYVEKGIYKYTYGETSDFNSIRKMRRTIAKDFKDAFIIAFKDGKKVKY